MPHPNLQSAMAKIQAVIKEHDLAAQITLVMPGHAEFLYEISPSWSCAFLEEVPGEKSKMTLRVKSKREDYPNLEAQKTMVRNTAEMFFSLHRCGEQTVEQMASMLIILADKFEMSHWAKDEP